MNVACAVATAAASVYMGNYWDQKGTVPLVNKYNEAVDSTKEIRRQLALIGIVWMSSTLLEIYSVIF